MLTTYITSDATSLTQKTERAPNNQVIRVKFRAYIFVVAPKTYGLCMACVLRPFRLVLPSFRGTSRRPPLVLPSFKSRATLHQMPPGLAADRLGGI